jgi:hypothetical protein
MVGAKQGERNWFTGITSYRAGYEAWVAWFARGLREPGFLERYDKASDAWEKSKIVGKQISEIRRTFRALTPSQREELAHEAESELRAGLKILTEDKKMIRELSEVAQDP